MSRLLNALLTVWQRNPALVVGFIDAVLVAAVTFGAPISEAEKAAIDGVLTALAAIIIRSQVSPVAMLNRVAASFRRPSG